MPLPKPDPDEDKGEFIDRCMGDDTMNDDYPDPGQRRAVCERQWDDDKEETKAMKYPHILRAIFSSPWAILPETLATIIDIVRFRADGGTLTADEIQQRIGSATRPKPRSSGAVAVLPLHGPIMQRMNMMMQVSGGTSTEIFGKQFQQVMAASEVNAVIIEADSPGGEVFGVEELASEIYKARGSKPIVAVVNSLMASAAYWIGAAADEVVVTPGGYLGSIGVFMPHIDFSEADKKAGVKTTLIHAGKYKVEGNEYEPLTDEARATFQGIVDEVYGRFVKSLARSRGVSEATVRKGYGEGRVVGAKQAVELGMADRVGTLRDTLARLGADPDKGHVLMPARAAQPRPDLSSLQNIRPDSRDLRRRRLRLVEKG